ncbi:ribonuclease 1-like [Vicia villosa]|uniref:ribonuclease 1-like n=1 Tax=Vicia villosa TaxID=3911 RepID=UPI00273A8156|nr:ribonuclease 1-like [Vicia villosa]
MKLFIFIIFFYLQVPNYEGNAYDFLKLVEQWPPAACLPNKCFRITNGFGVHGLWPSNTSGIHSRTCDSSTKFTTSMVQPLFPRINNSWPEVINGKEEWFWGHEWEAHGKCSEAKFPGSDYFKLALDIKDRANLLQALNSKNIKPGSSEPVKDFEDAIKSVINGKRPELRCLKDRKGVVYLHEVGLCLDPDGVQYIDCPLISQPPPSVTNCLLNPKLMLLPL